MKTRALAFPLVAAVAFTTAAPQLDAGQIRKEKVPAAVLQAFARSFPKATVSTYLVEKKQGKLFYQIQSMDVVGTRDVVYDGDGTMVEMREGLVLGGLPEAVVKAVNEKHPGGAITNAVRVTRGRDVSYEVTVRTVGKTVEMSVAAAPPAQPDSGYRLAAPIAIGGEGGWDYLKVDAGARRLYVSHATRVEVVDLDGGKVVGAIPDTQGVHGIALAPELVRGWISDGRANTVTVFDLKTLATLATVPVTGENPDAIAYDPASKRVFAFNGRTANATAIDATTGKVAGTVALGGKPEFAVVDGGGTVFVNVEDTSEVVAFDARTLEVKSRWPLAPCTEPSGLALDRAHRRLFAVCGNAMMAVVDADSGRIVTTLPTGDGTDGAAFDPGTATAFASNGAGTLTVVREESPEKFVVLGNLATKRGARTIALDESTHRLYLSTAQYGPPPSPTPEHPQPRPSIVPGTFEVLVVERQ